MGEDKIVAEIVAEIVVNGRAVNVWASELRKPYRSAPELLAALKGVVAIADRKTDEFDRARAAIKSAS